MNKIQDATSVTRRQQQRTATVQLEESFTDIGWNWINTPHWTATLKTYTVPTDEIKFILRSMKILHENNGTLTCFTKSI